MSSNMFTFGSATNKPFSFGSTPAFGAPSTSASTTTGFSFGLAPSTTASTTAPATSTTSSVLPTTGFSFAAAAPAPATVAPKFSFPTSTTTTAPVKAEAAKSGVTAGQPPATTISLSFSSPALTFGIPATAPLPPSTTSVAPASAVSTAISVVPKPTACLAPVSQSVVPVTAVSSGPVAAISSSATAPVSQPSQKPLTYDQLEEMINGWTLEVEEQEQLFTQQASRINNLDRCLMANADKIVDIGESVERLEHEQARIEHELDFSTQQQAELGQLLDQLEKALDDGGMRRDSAIVSQMPCFRGDLQREQMVQQQVALDKQIAEISKQLETATLKVQSCGALNGIGGPLQQIAQVLAKQMDALQWISDRTAELKLQMSTVKQDLGSAHDSTR